MQMDDGKTSHVLEGNYVKANAGKTKKELDRETADLRDRLLQHNTSINFNLRLKTDEFNWCWYNRTLTFGKNNLRLVKCQISLDLCNPLKKNINNIFGNTNTYSVWQSKYISKTTLISAQL